MKTRTGFVSNSSSSSFVVVATEDAHNKALAKLSKEQQEIVLQATAFKKFGDQRMALLSGHFENEGGYCYSQYFSNITTKDEAKGICDEDIRSTEEDNDDYSLPFTEAIEKYISIVQKDKKEATTLSI